MLIVVCITWYLFSHYVAWARKIPGEMKEMFLHTWRFCVDFKNAPDNFSWQQNLWCVLLFWECYCCLNYVCFCPWLPTKKSKRFYFYFKEECFFFFSLMVFFSFRFWQLELLAEVKHSAYMSIKFQLSTIKELNFHQNSWVK